MYRMLCLLVVLLSSSLVFANPVLEDRFTPNELIDVEDGYILSEAIAVTDEGYLMAGKAFLPNDVLEFLAVMQDYEAYPEFMQVSGGSGLIELEDEILDARVLRRDIDIDSLMGEIEYELDVYVNLSWFGFTIQDYEFTGQFSNSTEALDNGTIVVNGTLINPSEELLKNVKSITHYWEIFPTSEGTFVYYENGVEFAKPLKDGGFFSPSVEKQKEIIEDTISEKIQKVIQNYGEEMARR